MRWIKSVLLGFPRRRVGAVFGALSRTHRHFGRLVCEGDAFSFSALATEDSAELLVFAETPCWHAVFTRFLIADAAAITVLAEDPKSSPWTRPLLEATRGQAIAP